MRTSKEDRIVLIQEQQASGQTIRSFCEQKGISEHSFKGWLKTQRKQQLAEATHGFVPVKIQSASGVEPTCQITVGGMISIECHRNTTPELLELALRSAVSVCGRN